MPLRSILIADDDALLRESLSDVFADLGCKSETAADGSSAIEVLKHQRFDLVLSDIDMPDMTGFALLSWLSANQPTPSVLMSARADANLDRAAHEAGAIALLPKPVEVARLKLLLAQLFKTGNSGHLSQG